MDNFLDLVYDKNSPAYTKVTSMLAVIFVSKKEDSMLFVFLVRNVIFLRYYYNLHLRLDL